MTIDQETLDRLSIEELRTLRKDVDRAISSFEQRRRDAARAAAEDAVRAHGLKLSDLVGASPRAKGKGASPKYANPENASETWSGRGRRPAWVTAALDAGRSLEDLLL